MISLVENIFKENNFEIYEPEFLKQKKGFITISKDKTKINFFLILFKQNLREIDKEIVAYASEIKKLPEKYDNQMDKNFNLIVFLERESSINFSEEESKLVFEIEEDPYHFRKLIIPYMDVELNDLRQYLNDGQLLKLTFNKILNNKSLFLEFKNNISQTSAYSLVSRLFIKIPFFTYEGDSENLNDLSTILSDSLSILGLEPIRQEAFDYINEVANINNQELTDEELKEELKEELFYKWLGVERFE